MIIPVLTCTVSFFPHKCSFVSMATESPPGHQEEAVYGEGGLMADGR